MPASAPSPETFTSSWPRGLFAGGDYGMRRAAEMLGAVVEVLTTERVMQGLTQAQLEEITAIDQSTISGLERGKTWADTRTLMRIADALDIDIIASKRG